MQVSQMFEAKDVYFGALLGGIVGYFGFVALVGLSVVVGSGQIGQARLSAGSQLTHCPKSGKN